jgi:uncharacterized protein YfiM (DUF2279 family)
MNLENRISAWFYAHQDKVAHFAIFAVVALAFLLAGLPLGRHGALAISCTATVILGAGKEWRDDRKPGDAWDWWDLLADVLGGAVVWSAFLAG